MTINKPGKQGAWVSEMTVKCLSERRTDYRDLSKHILQMNLERDMVETYSFLVPIMSMLVGLSVFIILMKIL